MVTDHSDGERENLLLTERGWKEGNVLFNDALNTFLFTVIRCQIYGRGPLRWRGKKHAAATWATLSDLAARVILYASSYRQDSTYHSLCYTSLGAQAGTRNSLRCPP